MSVGLYSGVSGLALGIGLYRNVSGLWGGASGLIDGFGGADPYAGASLYLNFLAGAPLDSRITFSRGTNATLIDSTGRLTYAPNNLFLWSQEFDNATWGKTNATVTANVAIAPDGTATADAIIPAAGSSVKRVSQGFNATGITAAPFSIFVKANGYNKVALLDPQHTAVSSAVVDLRDGSQANILNTNGTTTVSAVGNGWYRITWVSSAFPPSAVNYTFAVTPLPDSGVTNSFSGAWTANGTDSILVWGAQIERITYQTTSSTYVATAASAYYGPRFDYDPVTLAPRGLLIEEARTNLVTYSDDWSNAAWVKVAATISANVTASPDGTANADLIVEDTTNNSHGSYQDATVVNGTTYTISVYAKRNANDFLLLTISQEATFVWFNLNSGAVGTIIGTGVTARITPAGNGWYRCSITRAATGAGWRTAVYTSKADNSTGYLGTGASAIFVYGAQLEAGSFATSYIPTVASTVTRNADVATMTGTNFSSWYNQSEGTFVIDSAYSPVSGASFGLACAFQGASNFININNNGNRALYVFVGGVNQVDLSPGGYVAYAPAKIASAYKVDDFATTINARTVLTDTSGTLPVPTSFRIGRDAQDLYINNHIRTIAYFNTRLPNAQLQTLTAPSLATTLSLDFTSGSYNVGF